MADTAQQPPQDDSAQGGDLAAKINELKASEQSSVHETYQQEIEVLKKAEKEANERSLRAMAELQNAKRRMDEEKKSFAAFANQGLILELLGIIENFNRSSEHLPADIKDHEWVKGVLLIDQQLNAFLAKHGVKEVSVNPGDSVDPIRHTVVMKAEGASEEKILEVFSKGYELNGRVIVTAKVRVG